MRFDLVGGLDVPDWLMSEVLVLSKISAVRIKLLAAAVVKQDLGSERLNKLLGESFKHDDAMAVVAAIHFILSSATRYDVAEDVLSRELQQLGLPREHTEALVKVQVESRAHLQQLARERSLRLPRLSSLGWRVHESAAGDAAHAVELQLGVQEAPGRAPSPLNLHMTVDTFTLLHSELCAAKEAMGRIPAEDASKGA